MRPFWTHGRRKVCENILVLEQDVKPSLMTFLLILRRARHRPERSCRRGSTPQYGLLPFRFAEFFPELGILTRCGPLKLMVQCGDGSTPQAHGFQRLRARHLERTRRH